MTATSDAYLAYPGGERRWAPCRAKCPVHIDVPGYLTAVSEGRFSDALSIVLERNPLPAVCGRVCLRPCEEGCRRCLLDDPIAIAAVKRAASDHGAYPATKPQARRPETVGVVGSGPAGLTAAYDLGLAGYGVTLYESRERLGGMMRYGIPGYRLPDAALDRDIDHILALGVKVECGVRVGQDVSIEELRSRHDAVLVAVGLQGSRPLPLPGADLPQVMAALPFLAASAEGADTGVGERVVVVGGGNVAMDVARTALRGGAAVVTAVCLEGRDIMPASVHEIAEAEQEGVRVIPSRGPRVVTGDDRVTGLRVVECASVFDSDGRFSPVFNENNAEEIPADTVIFAVGQGSEAADLGLPVGPRGLLEVDSRTLRTEVDGVFAAGDVTCGPTKIIDAVASGHRAAASIVEMLTGDDSALDALDSENQALGEVPEAMAAKLETRRRVEMERLEFYEAVKSMDEVEEGYTEYEAAREAQRCLSCTMGARVDREKCASCLTCVRVCPHGVPVFQPGGYPYFEATACFACGACAAECPACAIAIEGANESEMMSRVQRKLARPQAESVLAFVCGYDPELLDVLGPDARIISVSCLLRVSERVLLEACELGASRVVFTGCHPETCRFPHAIDIVARRVTRLRSLSAEVGLPDLFYVVGQEEPAEAEAGAATGGAARGKKAST